MQDSDFIKIVHDRLSAALSPDLMEIRDDSPSHAGHSGHHGRGASHLHIRIVSRVFQGLSRVAQQRLVYDLLKEELKDRIHALSLDLQIPIRNGE